MSKHHFDKIKKKMDNQEIVYFHRACGRKYIIYLSSSVGRDYPPKLDSSYPFLPIRPFVDEIPKGDKSKKMIGEI